MRAFLESKALADRERERVERASHTCRSVQTKIRTAVGIIVDRPARRGRARASPNQTTVWW
jgi:hypothetical protein